jgi:hypothetical protein
MSRTQEIAQIHRLGNLFGANAEEASHGLQPVLP